MLELAQPWNLVIDRLNPTPAAFEDCARYYVRGRVPIVAYATVQMQSPAYR